jgi:3-hydroxyacyl-[acyl-carrier-protein] dehydratase
MMNGIRCEIEASALGEVEKTEDGGRRRFRFARDFSGFAGHFPGYPILPAVLQVLMAQLVAEQLLGETLLFTALQRATVSEQVRPEAVIEVGVRIDELDGKRRCRCELRVNDKKAASFTLLLDKG